MAEVTTCRTARELMPLYLSAELEGSLRAPVDLHLAGCAVCRDRFDDQQRVDVALREALLAEEIAPGPILSRFRYQAVHKRAAIRVKVAAAAALVAMLAGGAMYWGMTSGQGGETYRAALQDHHRELVEKRPRRWVAETGEVETLAAAQGIASRVVGQLAPAGYRLERGKVCVLNGRTFLHLVYGNQDGEVSLFLRRAEERKGAPYSAAADGDYVSGVQAGGLSVMYVTDEAAEADQFAAQAALVL